MDRAVLVGRWRELTERLLPERAREQRWPLRLDHCFKRVCLDWALGDAWFRHCRRPAERNATSEELQRAVRCAEEILGSGVEVLRERNFASLGWRGKLVPKVGAHLKRSGDLTNDDRSGEG